MNKKQPWCTPFPTVNQSIHFSMPGYNCCFLTCTQISQDAGMVNCYSHLFPTVCCDLDSKSFTVVVSEAEVDVFFWNSLAFSMIQWMLAIQFPVPLPFLNPTCISRNSQFKYCWSLAWRILSITLLACEMSALVRKFKHSLALSFFGIVMKTDLFHSWPLLSFLNFMVYWVQHFDSIIF